METKLKKLGFSEKEAQVYLALMELGSAIVSDIAKKAGINRSTTYVVLEMLKKRGLVTVTEKRKGVKVYNSMSPERLVQYLKDEAKKLSEQASAAKNMLSDLKSLHKKSQDVTKPKVEFFEGRKNLESAYNSLSSARALFSVASENGNSGLGIRASSNKIIFASFDENFAVMIESPKFVASLIRILKNSGRKENS